MLIQCASKRTDGGMASGIVICCLHQNLLLGECMVCEKFRMACMKVPQWQTSQHHTPVDQTLVVHSSCEPLQHEPQSLLEHVTVTCKTYACIPASVVSQLYV